MLVDNRDGKGKKMGWRGLVATVIACLTALGVGGGAVAAVASTGPSESGVPQACAESGLAPPSHFKAHFQLETTPAHPRTTEPRAYVRYFLREMPPACTGAYVRVVKACIRYKTTRLPWKAVSNTLLDGRMPRCNVLSEYSPGAGTHGMVFTQEVGTSGYFYEFGRVVDVRGRARILIKDQSTGTVASQRWLPLPTTFSPKRKVA